MRRTLLLFALCLVGSIGCTRSIAPDEIEEACVRRLKDRTSAPSNEIEKFCSCIVAQSLKKMSAEEMAETMETGADSAVKELLKPEFAYCNAEKRR